MTFLRNVRGIVDRLRFMGDERGYYPRRLAVSNHNHQTVEFIQKTQCRFIAEFGIYKGYTSIEFARFLNGRGELHLFDYEDRVKEVAGAIRSAGFNNIKTFGSSYKLLDSYNWALSEVLKQHPDPIYDYVFLDGAHTWAVDALTTLLVDKLLVVGGYLDFDDYDWTLKDSSLDPKAFPLTRKLYTDAQIAADQVRMICDLLVRRDARYREVVPNKIFQKIA